MDRIAYADGRFCAPENIRIPLDDRSLFFGDAVYDAALSMDGSILDLSAHMQRLRSNMNALGIKEPMPPKQLRRCILEAASYIEGVCFLYVQVSRTSPTRRHAYDAQASSRLLITAERTELPDPEQRITLISTPDLRYGFCHIKTVNLLPNVLASRRARESGADEAVFLREGIVTECAHSNIAILQGGCLLTHPADRRILPGITRARLLSTCHDLGIPICERAFSYRELLEADAVLVTSTTKLCRTAVCIDGIPVGKDDRLAGRLCHALHIAFLTDREV